MNLLLLLIAFASFVIYALAIQNLFSRDHGVHVKMQALKACGSLFALIHLWALWNSTPEVSYQRLASLGAYAIGLGIFFFARRALSGHRLSLAFSPDMPATILDQGIYARVRHPFYLAYSCTWLGGVIAAPSPWTIATTAMMLGFYWHAANVEESKFACSPLSKAYREYQRRAGMFIPSVYSSPDSPCRQRNKDAP
jgi:protein-S-isoprenylcysteine O-methyltransferase Ste14